MPIKEINFRIESYIDARTKLINFKEVDNEGNIYKEWHNKKCGCNKCIEQRLLGEKQIYDIDNPIRPIRQIKRG